MTLVIPQPAPKGYVFEAWHDEWNNCITVRLRKKRWIFFKTVGFYSHTDCIDLSQMKSGVVSDLCHHLLADHKIREEMKTLFYSRKVATRGMPN